MAPLFTGTLWDELYWVFSPNKYGDRGTQYGGYWLILYAIPTTLVMLLLRYVLTRYCFLPFGTYLGVKLSKSSRLTPNPTLERIFKLATKQDRTPVLLKFSECCWRFVYYSSMFFYGLFVLWDKPWFLDITKTWDGYPYSLKITSDIWWYYILTLSFYSSLFITQFRIDHRRKDFWQTFLHHMIAILLTSFSWLGGVFRIGMVTLLIHDFSEIFLDIWKMAVYVKNYTISRTFFWIFTIIWFINRMWIYPCWIIKHTLVDLNKYQPNFPAYYTFNSLLVVLFVLHCYWSYVILKMAANAFKVGRVEGDVRSSSESEKEY